ncbi:zinc ribbon domain-containing protein YjdM [Marinomonas phaeophyticola]|uniref:zinc ribbon domain-containing protein YjdM n=1 Tax=Marinomonas phaeophyticola TaxID=3004091 RepID=UPI003D17B1DE
MSVPACPNGKSEYVYQDQARLIFPECAYEWNYIEAAKETMLQIKDSNRVLLETGNKTLFIKDLKVKGSPQLVKISTKAVIKRIYETQFTN